jgi:hypothetical protein
MADTRNIMMTPQSDNLNMIDCVLMENGNFLVGSLEVLEAYFSEHAGTSSLPQIYSLDKKGGSVATRGQVYTTIFNLITASYDGVGEGKTLYIGILDTTLKVVKYGIIYVTELKAVIVYDDESTEDFNKDDVTALIALIISPYGEILGTEDWIEV